MIRMEVLSYKKMFPVEYRCWLDMKTRCYNSKHKSYQWYGAKGITVCKRWIASFESFIKDMGTKPTNKHSIDRINNSGNYEPENCRWATPLEQSNNLSTVRSMAYLGIKKSLSAWAREIKVSPSTLRRKLKQKPFIVIMSELHGQFAKLNFSE